MYDLYTKYLKHNDKQCKTNKCMVLTIFKNNKMRYKCNLCGRDKFTHKIPHKCIGGFRKRGLKWTPIPEKELEIKNN